MTDRFVYVTYINAPRQKVWDALIKPEFTRQYWSGVTMESTFTKGASWMLRIPDGRMGDAGEVLEVDAPRRLVVSWRNEFIPEMTAEGFSKCSFDLSEERGVTKLTIVHEIDGDGSKLIEGVSSGWPHILASLKTLLETGKPLPGTSEWPKGV